MTLSAGLLTATNVDAAKTKPIVLETQGSYAVGGKTIKHAGTFSQENFLSPDGQKAYGDHLYVFYQIPVNAHKYPDNFSARRRTI